MKKPGGLAIMIGLGKKKPGAGVGMGMGKDDEEYEEGSAGAEEEALSEFFEMGKNGNMAGAHEAMSTYMSLCYPGIEDAFGEGMHRERRMSGIREEGEASEEA